MLAKLYETKEFKQLYGTLKKAPIKLKSPQVLVIYEGVLSWEEVPLADEYNIYLFDTLIATTDKNIFDLNKIISHPGTFTIGVQATAYGCDKSDISTIDFRVYSITGEYTGCYNTNEKSIAIEGSLYRARIIPLDDYTLDDAKIEILSGDIDITSEVYDETTNIIYIPHIQDNISISIDATLLKLDTPIVELESSIISIESVENAEIYEIISDRNTSSEIILGNIPA